ncbi:unnamed protein product [Symbiodinium sp. KB8]|nr:unnamed protein product [Symbiodinium sp. KB8]
MCHWGAACDKVDCWRIHPPERDDFAYFSVTPPQDFCLYLDEIPMVRPDVAALPTDKEVFIDPLPFEKGTEELGQFLAAFGEVEEDLRPDTITYNTAIRIAQHKTWPWSQACFLLCDLRELALKGDLISRNTALTVCRGAGHLRLCLQLLADLVLQRLEADVVTYSTAISACDPQDWQTALSLLGQMEHTGLEINLVCYSAALQACGRSTQWQRGLILYSRFERSQPVLRFDVVPLSAVLESLESSRQQLLLVQLLPRVEMMCYQGMQ